MIAHFFTNVTHGSDVVAQARDASAIVLGRDVSDDLIVVSPIFNDYGPIGPRSRQLSILTPIPSGTLEAAIVAGPVRYFRDNYGTAFLVHIYNALRQEGQLIVPFQTETIAERTGFWSLVWLQELFGQPQRLMEDEKLAVFIRGEKLDAPPSVLSCVYQDGREIMNDHFRNRGQVTTSSYIDTCSSMLVEQVDLAVSSKASAGAEPFESSEQEQFISAMNYSVTGVAYKTEGLRRLIDRHIDHGKDIRVVDFGGGTGLVGMELLLSRNGISKLVNCEPMASNLPVMRRLYQAFERELNGRYKTYLGAAQSYAFSEEIDVLCAFASLLYIPHELRLPTLERAWNALRPGGIFIIHENIKRPLFEPKDYYDLMFTSGELDELLSSFGEIERFRSSDILPITAENSRDLTVFRVVKKKA